MNKLKKLINITTVLFAIIGIVTITLAYFKAKDDILIKYKEQATLNYYESAETLLDSLCINEGDSIFNTNVGIKYLENKYTFDSLFIGNDRRN